MFTSLATACPVIRSTNGVGHDLAAVAGDRVGADRGLVDRFDQGCVAGHGLFDRQSARSGWPCRRRPGGWSLVARCGRRGSGRRTSPAPPPRPGTWPGSRSGARRVSRSGGSASRESTSARSSRDRCEVAATMSEVLYSLSTPAVNSSRTWVCPSCRSRAMRSRLRPSKGDTRQANPICAAMLCSSLRDRCPRPRSATRRAREQRPGSRRPAPRQWRPSSPRDARSARSDRRRRPCMKNTRSIRTYVRRFQRDQGQMTTHAT